MTNSKKIQQDENETSSQSKQSDAFVAPLTEDDQPEDIQPPFSNDDSNSPISDGFSVSFDLRKSGAMTSVSSIDEEEDDIDSLEMKLIDNAPTINGRNPYSTRISKEQHDQLLKKTERKIIKTAIIVFVVALLLVVYSFIKN